MRLFDRNSPFDPISSRDRAHSNRSIPAQTAFLASGIRKEKLKDQGRPFPMNPATNLIHDEALIDALASYVHSLGSQ